MTFCMIFKHCDIGFQTSFKQEFCQKIQWGKNPHLIQKIHMFQSQITKKKLFLKSHFHKNHISEAHFS